MHTPYDFHNLRFGGQAYVDTVRQLARELEWNWSVYLAACPRL